MMIRLLCLLSFFVSDACSDDYEKREYKKIPARESAAWLAVKDTVKDECGRCHNGSVHPLNLSIEANYRAKAKGRIENASMPPDKILDVEVKRILLSYFNS